MKLKDLQEKIHARAPKVAEKVQNDLAFQIGLRIEVARARKGMTQKELAERVGTKQPSIARIESGASLPTVSFLEKIANALDVSLEVTLSAPTTITVSHTAFTCMENTATQNQPFVQSPYAKFIYQSA